MNVQSERNLAVKIVQKSSISFLRNRKFNDTSFSCMVSLNSKLNDHILY